MLLLSLSGDFLRHRFPDCLTWGLCLCSRTVSWCSVRQATPQSPYSRLPDVCTLPTSPSHHPIIAQFVLCRACLVNVQSASPNLHCVVPVQSTACLSGPCFCYAVHRTSWVGPCCVLLLLFTPTPVCSRLHHLFWCQSVSLVSCQLVAVSLCVCSSTGMPLCYSSLFHLESSLVAPYCSVPLPVAM